MDSDHDGQITLGEFRSPMTRNLDVLHRALDKDSDGGIGIREFNAVLEQLRDPAAPPLSDEQKKNQKLAFLLFDIEENGKITLKELKQVVNKILQLLFVYLDKNDDEKLDEDELKQVYGVKDQVKVLLL